MYDKRALLQVWSKLSSTADFEAPQSKTFLQMERYQDIQDPLKMLVVGGRGSGKTRVYRTLTGENGFRLVIGDKKVYNRPHAENTVILPGFDMTNKDMPSSEALSGYARDEQASAFWMGGILFLLLDKLRRTPTLRDSCNALAAEFLSKDGLDVLGRKENFKLPGRWISIVESHMEACNSFLDAADDLLCEHDRWILLAYDQLDRISLNRTQTCVYIRALLSLWFGKIMRWRHLKAKVFLRTDLLNPETLRFPDSSKLSACQLLLTWDTLSLYRLLVRRLANTEAEPNPMLPYLQSIRGLVSLTPERGYEPCRTILQYKALIQKAIGEYMGSNPKKGRSFIWVLNHLQDANGILAPRPFLKCYSVAADFMLREENEHLLRNLVEDRIILPSALQGAIQDVSADRVIEMREDYAWLENLRTVLYGETLLMPEAELDRKLDQFLSSLPSEQIPESSVEGLKKLLQELGIILIAPDHRINMPEIYLHGLGLKRKGGIKRMDNP